MESKKRLQVNLKEQNRVINVENKFMVTGGKEGGINGKTGIVTYTRLCIKQVTNKDLPYSTGNSAQCSVMTHMGKEPKKKSKCEIGVTDSLCCTPETNTAL